MTIKLSSLYKMKVYGLEGGLIGKVKDIVLNLEDGIVVRLLLKAMNKVKPENLTSFLSNRSFKYQITLYLNKYLIVGVFS